jgi:hypothetical protein
MTARALDEMGVPYKIVIEDVEYDDYASVIDPSKILRLPFSNLGQGSIPARNWVWSYSESIGAKRHWVLDDNIGSFRRLNNNLQIKVSSGAIFRAAEDFVDRYENVRLAGFQYDFFLPSKYKFPAFLLNTRIYSCILVDNSIKHRWRGKYNEDTDLSLRVLKDGDCTILFNAFIQEKKETLSMSGGNSELYKDNGRKEMAQSLVDQHPDVTRIIWKYNRWQHYVNYKPFKKNKLIRNEKWNYSGVNNYGMKLITINK